MNIRFLRAGAALTLLAALPLFSTAQDLAIHIPATASYVITLNPGNIAAKGDIKTLSGLEMFSRNGDEQIGSQKLGGREDEDEKMNERITLFLSNIFAKPADMGVKTSDKAYIFSEDFDTLSHWTYLIGLDKPDVMEQYLTGTLFKDKKVSVEKTKDYSRINEKHIAVAWTNNYVVIMLADYYRYSYLDSYMLYEETTDDVDTLVSDETAIFNDSIRRDSLSQALIAKMMAEAKEAEARQSDTTTIYEEAQYGSRWERQAAERQKMREKRIHKRVENRIDELVNQPQAKSVLTIKNFGILQNETFDAAYWYNVGEAVRQSTQRTRYIYSQYEQKFDDTVSQAQKFWEDTYTMGLATFENGEVHMLQKMYMNPRVASLQKGIYSGRIDKKLLRYVKGENLMGFACVSMKPEKMFNYLMKLYRTSLSDYEGIAQGMFVAWDVIDVFLDKDVMYNLFSGDMMIAMTDLKPYLASYVTYEYDENFNRVEVRKEKTEIMPEFIMIASVGRTEKMQQIIDAVERVNGLKKQSKGYYTLNLPGQYDFKVHLIFKDGLLIVTNNDDLVNGKHPNGYGKNGGMSKEQRSLARKSPLVGYWNGTKTFDLVGKQSTIDLSDSEKATLDVLKTSISNATVVGIRPINGVQTIDIRLKLTDIGENSLVKFFRILNSFYMIK